MKHDKKIQRQAVVMAARAEANLDDDDDIVRNMTNLILHKNEEQVKPWEKSMMALETASNTCISNGFMKHQAPKRFG